MFNFPTIFRFAFALFALCVLTVFPAHASQVSVSPVRVDLDETTKIVPITVYNAGDEVVVMETTMRIWNQSAAGQWILSSTDDVQAYPGLIRIQPKGSAVVRVGLAPGASVSARQGTYRLFLRELVDPRPGAGANVRMVLNINLPVFIGGAGSSLPSSTALTATVHTPGVVNFTYQNPKTAATLSPQLAMYSWLDGKGEVLSQTQGKIDAYALPGGLGRWNQPLPVDCAKVDRVRIKGELGVAFDVPVSCKP